MVALVRLGVHDGRHGALALLALRLDACGCGAYVRLVPQMGFELGMGQIGISVTIERKAALAGSWSFFTSSWSFTGVLLTAEAHYKIMLPEERFGIAENSSYAPMMDENERECLERLCPFADGNPRRLKRIINVFNVGRRVVELRRGNGLGLKPASMTLESVSACRPPTSASVASLRLGRCRGSTSGTHPAALTSPTRLGGYVDLEYPPEDVGRYLSKRRVYPHAASWQGRNRGRPPRRRLRFEPHVGVVVLREGDISTRTPQVALGVPLALISKPVARVVPDHQTMDVEREHHDRARVDAGRDLRRCKVQAGRLQAPPGQSCLRPPVPRNSARAVKVGAVPHPHQYVRRDR